MISKERLDTAIRAHAELASIAEILVCLGDYGATDTVPRMWLFSLGRALDNICDELDAALGAAASGEGK